MRSPLHYFLDLTDPRVERTREHRPDDIIFIAIASVICGAEGWNDTEEVWQHQRRVDENLSPIANGIPSHDTFNRVFSALNPEELENCFVE